VLKNLQNELAKLKIEMESSEQEIRELNIQNSDIRERYEAELSSKIAAEDKLVRSNQEINNLKFQIARGEEEATALRNTIEQMEAKREEEVEEVATTIHHLEQTNRESHHMLQESNAKISELKREVEECNRGIEESFKKERDHQVSIVRCEQEIAELHTYNERLTMELKMAKENVAKIIEIGQLINRSIGVN
jgi:chromosome segregation ATPase